MEYADWMNERVRGEIDALQRTHGFEEDEAAAYWLLQRAWELMGEIKRRDLRERIERKQKSQSNLEDAAYAAGSMIYSITEMESDVAQHFMALYKELGRGVLRRNFPDGWGKAYRDADEED